MTVWQVLMSLADKLLEKKFCGDPQTAIDKAYKVTMAVDRKSPTDLENAGLSSSLGQISLDAYHSNDACSDRVVGLLSLL